MKHKTAELTGELLDAAVALAEGRLLVSDEPEWPKGDYKRLRKEFGGRHIVRWYANGGEPETAEVGGWEPIDNWGSPSTDWLMGGPLIDRERIAIYPGAPDTGNWFAHTDPRTRHWPGPTPLIAAMRAFVASKLGDEVELP